MVAETTTFAHIFKNRYIIHTTYAGKGTYVYGYITDIGGKCGIHSAGIKAQSCLASDHL